MGRKDPARVQAIRTELALMEHTIGEDIVDVTSIDLDEESRENRDMTEIYNEASRICGQLEREGKLPADWWKERLQSQRNTIMYQAVCDTWEARMDDGINWNPVTGQVSFDDAADNADDDDDYDIGDDEDERRAADMLHDAYEDMRNTYFNPAWL